MASGERDFWDEYFQQTTTLYNTNPHLFILIRADCLA